ncbi:MAG: hypothetical protein ACLPN2_09875, partial [Terriglobales bacterium]
MLLNKLESGFLVLQTQQGLVVVEPSFWQRVYLLWTFRNFRQLSTLLLNSRQTELINNLFRQHAAVVSHEYEPSLEIGVVEDFVPPAIEIVATLAAKTDASPAEKAKLPEQTAGQYVAPQVIPTAASPAMKFDGPLAVVEEKAVKEGTVIDRVETAPKNALDRSFAPIISWLRLASSNLGTSKPAASRPQASRIVISGFAAAIGALSLCACFIVAFHRIGAVPGSQAHSSPPQLNSPDSPSAPGPTSVAENPATVPEATPQADAGPDAAVKPASAEVASSITTTHRTMTPERASRGATAHVASRSSGGSHAAAFSRVPASTSTRRITLAPGSRGTMARSAQSYFDLANQQMHEGNYAAAAANYTRAWRIEENSAAAKGRLVRARRAMQAENDSIA